MKIIIGIDYIWVLFLFLYVIVKILADLLMTLGFEADYRQIAVEIWMESYHSLRNIRSVFILANFLRFNLTFSSFLLNY